MNACSICHELGRNAQAVFAGETTAVLPQLMRAGGSPGGARPKVLVGIKGDEILSGADDLPEGFEHWIIKFSARDDARDAGPVEYAYAAMARKAGIDIPETHLFRTARNESYFGVRRFDRRPANHRLHVHTFGNLIHANFRIPSTDYADLLKIACWPSLAVMWMCCARSRRMVFNVAAHNRDDHAKNFAFIMNPLGEWTLSPAYDMTHSPGPGGEHMMTVGGEGATPGREHILKLAGQCEVSLKEASIILDEVNTSLMEWKKFADEAGCTRKRTNMIGSTFTIL